MSEYVSIKDEVLSTLKAHFPEIRERFGVETLGVFGSVSLGEDTTESDVDILYRFYPDHISYEAFLDLSEYLENILGRNVDLISLDDMQSSFRKSVEKDIVFVPPGERASA